MWLELAPLSLPRSTSQGCLGPRPCLLGCGSFETPVTVGIAELPVAGHLHATLAGAGTCLSRQVRFMFSWAL